VERHPGPVRQALDGRRLLVLGAGAQREFAFHTWARLGLHVILVDGFSHQRYERQVDDFHPLDVRDHVAADRQRLDAVAREANGVVTLHEFTVGTAAGLAAAAGWPGPGASAAAVSRDKRRFRALLAAAGVAVPDWADAASPADLSAFFAGGRRRAVLKPADLASSASVRRVAGPVQAARHLERVRELSFSGAAIVEEYLDGPEYSVEGVVRAGELALAIVTAKTLGSPRCFLERQHVVPAALGDRDHRALVAATAASARAMGVRDAVIHAELRLVAGRAMPIEVACRPGGDLIPDLVALAAGVNLYEVQAAQALGVPHLPPPAFTRVAGVRFLIAQGTVSRFVEPSLVARRHPGVLLVNQLLPAGRRVPPPAGNWARAGCAIAVGPDHDTVERTLGDAIADLAGLMGVAEVPG
jgi:S-sulfo-L-cysteine synthase (3-phospho-L-serine-dependent)